MVFSTGGGHTSGVGSKGFDTHPDSQSDSSQSNQTNFYQDSLGIVLDQDKIYFDPESIFLFLQASKENLHRILSEKREVRLKHLLKQINNPTGRTEIPLSVYKVNENTVKIEKEEDLCPWDQQLLKDIRELTIKKGLVISYDIKVVFSPLPRMYKVYLVIESIVASHNQNGLDLQ